MNLPIGLPAMSTDTGINTTAQPTLARAFRPGSAFWINEIRGRIAAMLNKISRGYDLGTSDDQIVLRNEKRSCRVRIDAFLIRPAHAPALSAERCRFFLQLPSPSLRWLVRQVIDDSPNQVTTWSIEWQASVSRGCRHLYT